MLFIDAGLMLAIFTSCEAAVVVKPKATLCELGLPETEFCRSREAATKPQRGSRVDSDSKIKILNSRLRCRPLRGLR